LSDRGWHELNEIERAVLINAFEIDAIDGVLADVDGIDSLDDTAALAKVVAVVLSFVDQGLVEVRRYISTEMPDGRRGIAPGPLVPRDELPRLLEDRDTWDEPSHPFWVGAIILVGTPAGRRICFDPPAIRSRS
jgi:hypothetical protein